MIQQLRGVLGPVVTTTPVNERCLPAETLAREFRGAGIEAVPVEDIGGALELGRGMASSLLVVTGSFFVTGDAMLHAWRSGWIGMPESGEEPEQLFSDGSDVDTPERTGL
jgi:hypothetical protein